MSLDFGENSRVERRWEAGGACRVPLVPNSNGGGGWVDGSVFLMIASLTCCPTTGGGGGGAEQQRGGGSGGKHGKKYDLLRVICYLLVFR